jgi:lipopolysaccharide/colanic/teichoic acid biosynthesis glycosyltransferase
MDDDITREEISEEQKQKDQEVIDQQKKEKDLIRRKLEERGHRQVSFSEYETIQGKKAKKKPLKTPKIFKGVFKIFGIILTCICMVFVMYMIYLIATGEDKYTQSEMEDGFSSSEHTRKNK